MLDINLLRNNFNETAEKVRSRGKKYEQLDSFNNLDKSWREISTKIQNINANTNKISKEIGLLIAKGDKEGAEQLKRSVKQSKQELEELNAKKEKLEVELNDILYSIPNIPDKTVPIGADENENKEIKRFSSPTNFDFQPKPHWELAESLGLIDFERGVKVCGSRYILYKGLGAKLIRALQWYTIDMNIKAGFQELLPPVVVKRESLVGTGQLPKFEEDLYKLNSGDYLSPTGEVQLTNYFRDEILDGSKLPYHFTTDTCCFRSEAGSAGKDTRGVIRQHQFYKTEMVKITKQENSFDELEHMTSQAEKILESLNLPHRRIVLCTGDMGFSSSKTYDIEVWLPSYNSFKEISSCSNCLDFQARNLKLRYKDKDGQTKYCHTLNGSGLAIDRLWAAVVENYQQADGSILIPEPLRKYFDGEKYIK